MDDRNVYEHQQFFKLSNFWTHREKQLKLIVKKRVKHRNQFHLKTNVSAATDIEYFMKPIQIDPVTGLPNDLRFYIRINLEMMVIMD